MKKLKYVIVGLLGLVSALAQAQTTLTLKQFATKLKQTPNAQIIDARSEEEFAQIHLKDAITIDLQSANYKNAINKLSQNRPVFIYAIANTRSNALTKVLLEKGFKEVYQLPGGLANWIGSGYPTVFGTKKGLSLSPAQFAELSGSSDLVLFDFGSKYCGACKKLVPVLDSLKAKTSFSAKVVSIEVFDNTQLARQLKINVLPTLVLYHNKKQIWKKQGFSSTKQIQQIVENSKSQLTALD